MRYLLLVGLMVLVGTAYGEDPVVDFDGRILAISVPEDIAQYYVLESETITDTGLAYDDVFRFDLSPDEQYFYFHQFADEAFQIFTMLADGTRVQQLTDIGVDVYLTRWMPTSDRIMFGTMDEELFTMTRAGNDVRALTEVGLVSNPSWSPDGRLLVFTATNTVDEEIYLFDGTETLQLTDNEVNEDLPFWSPNGEYIFFSSQRTGTRELYRMNADSSEVTQLTFDGTNDFARLFYRPRYSPDGQYIVYLSDRRADRYDLYLMDNTGDNMTHLYPDIVLQSVGFSPDGESVIFHVDHDGDQDVALVDLDGQNFRRLTENDAHDGISGWSPDGEYVLLNSDIDGDFEIYRMHWATGDIRRITNNDYYDWGITWYAAE